MYIFFFDLDLNDFKQVFLITTLLLHFLLFFLTGLNMLYLLCHLNLVILEDSFELLSFPCLNLSGQIKHHHIFLNNFTKVLELAWDGLKTKMVVLEYQDIIVQLDMLYLLSSNQAEFSLNFINRVFGQLRSVHVEPRDVLKLIAFASVSYTHLTLPTIYSV